MKSARAFLLLGLIAAAIILLLSSEVAARDLAETSTENGVNDAKHDGYGGGGYPGGGYPGGRGGGYPGRGGRCRYGCCGSGYYGRCRCCASAAEAEQKAAAEVKPQN